MPSSTSYLIAVGGAAVLGACLWYYDRLRRLPTAEEQAWLEQQMATPKPTVLSPGSQVSEEEQRWLDKQIDDAATADVRQCPCPRHATSATHYPCQALPHTPPLGRCSTMRGKRPTPLGRAHRCATCKALPHRSHAPWPLRDAAPALMTPRPPRDAHGVRVGVRVRVRVKVRVRVRVKG